MRQAVSLVAGWCVGAPRADGAPQSFAETAHVLCTSARNVHFKKENVSKALMKVNRKC